MSLVIRLAGYGLGANNRPTHSRESLRRMAEYHKALIVDVRAFPYSRCPDYCYGAMRDYFRSRYASIAYWGEGFSKEDWEEGLRQFKIVTSTRLIDGENRAQSIILLCACRSEVECHRVELGKLLAAEGYTVKSLVWLRFRKTEPKPVKQAQGTIAL